MTSGRVCPTKDRPMNNDPACVPDINFRLP